MGTFFYWNGSLDAYMRNSLYSLFILNREMFMSVRGIFIVSIIPLVLFLLTFFKLLQTTRYVYYQYKCQRIMLLWMVFGVFYLLVSRDLSAYHLYVFLPFFVFFTVHYLSLVNRAIFQEMIFLMMDILLSSDLLLFAFQLPL